jgi:hypothetical protein
MEIIQDFYNDKDEQKFLQRCTEENIPCDVVQRDEMRVAYKIGGRKPIAIVSYYAAISSVNVVWFTCNF